MGEFLAKVASDIDEIVRDLDLAEEETQAEMRDTIRRNAKRLHELQKTIEHKSHTTQ